MKSGKHIAANEAFALAFGLFLGLCILKFGNPVILDKNVTPPTSFAEYWTDAWPTHWANWFLVPLAAIGAALIFQLPASRRPKLRRWLFIFPLLWLSWQLFSAGQTVDAVLTVSSLWQFFGCVACYYIGAFLFGSPRALNFLLVGILAALVVCLIHAVDQHIEYPGDAKVLLEGQRVGWTNFPPEEVLEMKRDQTIITTNGMDVANPIILAKFAKGRVMGTLIYPNALAGAVLLLFPLALVLVVQGARKLRPMVGLAAMALTVGLTAAAFVWSGSKFGWLIGLLLLLLSLCRLNWSLKLKISALALVAVVGLGVFAFRFHSYFEHGATSTTARFDYWRAAVQTACSHPLLGTGPGTFQRPYAVLKSPDAEMARLTHNDYLEQFSDSGFMGGIFYAAWIIAGLVFASQRLWKSRNLAAFALLLGLLGWFIQGVGEFSLFIPALAWIAFTFLGCALTLNGDAGPAPNPFDKKPGATKIVNK